MSAKKLNRLPSVEALERRMLLSSASAAVVTVMLDGSVTVKPGVSPPVQSMLTSVAVKFSSDVSVAPTALSLQNLSGNTAVDPASMHLSWNKATDTETWTFPSMVGGSLPDGRYQSVLKSSLVTDPDGNPMDGDGDGKLGGNYSFNFGRLFGDADGDGAVGPADAIAFEGAYETGKGDSHYQSRFDFNSDGAISDFDRTADEARFGTVLGRAAANSTAASSPATATPAQPAVTARVTNPGIKTITIQARRTQSAPWSNFSVQTLPAGLTMSCPTLSKYGGDTSHKLAATGYFHTTKLNGKWWMVDPEGDIYFENAVGVVGPQVYPDNAAGFVSKFGSGPTGDLKWATWGSQLASEHRLLLGGALEHAFDSGGGGAEDQLHGSSGLDGDLRAGHGIRNVRNGPRLLPQ